MNSAVTPAVNMTAWYTRARRAAKSAIPSQRWSAASGTGEPSDQAADNRAVPAATVRAPAADTHPAPGSTVTHPGYVHRLQRPAWPLWHGSHVYDVSAEALRESFHK